MNELIELKGKLDKNRFLWDRGKRRFPTKENGYQGWLNVYDENLFVRRLTRFSEIYQKSKICLARFAPKNTVDDFFFPMNKFVKKINSYLERERTEGIFFRTDEEMVAVLQNIAEHVPEIYRKIVTFINEISVDYISKKTDLVGNGSKFIEVSGIKQAGVEFVFQHIPDGTIFKFFTNDAQGHIFSMLVSRKFTKNGVTDMGKIWNRLVTLDRKYKFTKPSPKSYSTRDKDRAIKLGLDKAKASAIKRQLVGLAWTLNKQLFESRKTKLGTWFFGPTGTMFKALDQYLA